MSVASALKREGVTQGWNFIIENATGEAPYIERTEVGNFITWKPGQAKKMETYLDKAMKEEEYDPEGINVDVDLMPVLLPLLVKKTIGYVVGAVAIIFFAGQYVGRQGR